MSEKYPLDLVNRNLEQWSLYLERSGGEAYLKTGAGEKVKGIKISVRLGQVTSDEIEALSSELARRLQLKKSDVASRLIEKPNFWNFRKLANILLAVFTAGLIFFGLERLNITGFVLGNITNSTNLSIGISNSTTNIGIVVCVLVIIGLLFYRLKK